MSSNCDTGVGLLLLHSIYLFIFCTVNAIDLKCVKELEHRNPDIEIRYTSKELTKACSKFDDWDSGVQKRLHKLYQRRQISNKTTVDGIDDDGDDDKPNSPISSSGKSWLNGVWLCNDLKCICTDSNVCDKIRQKISTLQSHIGNRSIGTGLKARKRRQASQRRRLSRAVRKEYRMMTDQERYRFHNVLNQLKREYVGRTSKFDLIIVYHNPEGAPGAHFGPGLLPFHRELLKQFEIAMRRIDPRVSIPYWDNSLDEPLPNPADSIIWTADFLGNGNGDVARGPFWNWTTLPDNTLADLSPSRHIVRSLGQNSRGGLVKATDKTRMNNIQSYQQLTWCVDPYFELLHGTHHMWVGGHMDNLRLSPNDPVFFMVHSFIDKEWEDWRLRHQNRWQRENDYPSDGQSCNTFHTRNARMRPFRIRNIDGHSNRYTDVFYTFQPTATCSRQNPNCGSQYIFCDTRWYRCVSKVRMGGRCDGFGNEDICYNGRCWQGRCIAAPRTTTQRPTPPPTTRRPWTTTTRAPLPPAPPTRNELEAENIGVLNDDPLDRLSNNNVELMNGVAQVLESVANNIITPSLVDSQALEPPFTAIPEAPGTIQVATIPGPPGSSGVALNENSIRSVWFPITVLRGDNNRMRPFSSGSILSSHGRNEARLRGRMANGVSPTYPGSAFAQVLSPFSNDGQTRATITVRDERNNLCTAMCLQSSQADSARYRRCTVASVNLNVDPRQSDNIAFTPEFNQAHLLSWQSNRRLADPFVFVCYFDNPPSMTQLWELRLTARTGNTQTAATNSAPDVNNGCQNAHRCCSLWANVGECQRNAWMRLSCQKSCFVCNPGSESTRQGCIDTNDDCPEWARNGDCRSNSEWMEENCKRSCRMCNRSQQQLRNICGSSRQTGECDDYHPDCRLWSNSGECESNPWWMAENCPLSCRQC